MTIRRLTFIILSLLALTLPAQAAESASDIIAKAADKFSSAPSISASYTMTSSAGGSTSGKVLFSGQKFHMTSPELLTWYDGTTQWTYLVADNEVNISEPTADELQQINPFAVISTFRRGYSAKIVRTDKSTKVVTLTAQSGNAEIRSATIHISASTMLPAKIELSMRSGQSATITISGITIGKTLNINSFRFPKARYPKAEVVDLR